MKAESKFLNKPLEFWANIRLISQKVGYTDRKTSQIKIPTLIEIQNLFTELDLDSSAIINNGIFTPYGNELIEYFKHRAKFLEKKIKPNLLNEAKAKLLYEKLSKKLKPTCPQPMNKQKGKKKAKSYYTCIINMLIEANSMGYHCDYDPRELTAFTKNKFPIRSMSRRVDGAFPKVINPVAIWEIKEYYYTTTFGSRVADGVYETLLDGYELDEINTHLGKEVKHYLMVDDYLTWWTMGRSYLCRICDMLHMGLITEALFGKEVIVKLPIIVKEWIKEVEKQKKATV